MNLIEKFHQKAQNKNTTIVLPEASDERVIQAAKDVVEKKLAKIIILGEEKEITEKAKKFGLDLDTVTFIDPEKSSHLEEYAEEYYELRKHKGMTIEKAKSIIKNPLYFGSMLVRKNIAHGLVAGSASPTADVMRATLQIIKTAEGINSVSSFFYNGNS